MFLLAREQFERSQRASARPRTLVGARAPQTLFDVDDDSFLASVPVPHLSNDCCRGIGKSVLDETDRIGRT
ncbi:MAG: hypothetical protein ACXV47_04795 [Halobacteriota archaeon]